MASRILSRRVQQADAAGGNGPFHPNLACMRVGLVAAVRAAGGWHGGPAQSESAGGRVK